MSMKCIRELCPLFVFCYVKLWLGINLCAQILQSRYIATIATPMPMKLTDYEAKWITWKLDDSLQSGDEACINTIDLTTHHADNSVAGYLLFMSCVSYTFNTLGPRQNGTIC